MTAKSARFSGSVPSTRRFAASGAGGHDLPLPEPVRNGILGRKNAGISRMSAEHNYLGCRARWTLSPTPYPPPGVEASNDFRHPDALTNPIDAYCAGVSHVFPTTSPSTE
jgi:hypothetical protein